MEADVLIESKRGWHQEGFRKGCRGADVVREIESSVAPACIIARPCIVVHCCASLCMVLQDDDVVKSDFRS